MVCDAIRDMFDFNVDLAVECIKRIRDNSQCVTCDKLSGRRVRFPCGHSVCNSCAEQAGECLSCVSSLSGSYQVDQPHTARLNNASALLSAFQDAFEIDVYKRQRISDHLKLEKQVFPECIQAPQKYCNKRKSLNISSSNKENISRTIFPGEEIVHRDTAKMNKSYQYVQNWLNQHENVHHKVSRKPFGDININTQSLLQTQQKNLVKHGKDKTKVIATKAPYVKRTHVKSMKNSSSVFNNRLKEVTDRDAETKVLQEQDKHETIDIKHNCDRNESGIVIDEEPIVLDDTDEIIDKDKLAWLAVLEAAKRDECQDNQILSQSVLPQSDNCLTNYEKNDSKLDINESDCKADDFSKVLFYKKSLLYDSCKLCRNSISNQNITTKEDKNKDVSIVINNAAFVTTIKFSQCVQEQEKTPKKSVEIQTMLPQCEVKNDGNSSLKKRKNLVNDDIIPAKIIKPEVAIQSLDVFPTTETKESTKLESNDCANIAQNVSNSSLKQLKSVIIEDSDTESNISYENIYEVVADVHGTSAPETVGHGILTPMTSYTKYQDRPNRPLRGHTPNSSDSSDKENLDPNRGKKPKPGKKQKHKINKNRKI